MKRSQKRAVKLQMLIDALNCSDPAPNIIYTSNRYPRRVPETDVALHYNHKTRRMWFFDGRKGRRKWKMMPGYRKKS